MIVFKRMLRKKLNLVYTTIRRKGWICLIVCLGMIISAGLIIESFGSVFGPKKSVFSLEAEEETLGTVFEKLSKTSGYKIVLNNDEWKTYRVTIRMENVTLQEAISRSLRDLNHALIFDDTNKRVIILVTGKIGSRAKISDTSRKRYGRDKRPGVTVSGKQTVFIQATRTNVD